MSLNGTGTTGRILNLHGRVIYVLLWLIRFLSEKILLLIGLQWELKTCGVLNQEKHMLKIPTDDNGFQIVKSEYERTAAAMIRNYWFGRYYGIIDLKW